MQTETSTSRALKLLETIDEESEIYTSATNTNTSTAGADEVGDTFAATPCEERSQPNPQHIPVQPPEESGVRVGDSDEVDARSQSQSRSDAASNDRWKRLANKDLNTILSVLERQLHLCRRICPDDGDCF